MTSIELKITRVNQILEKCKWINPNLLAFDLHSEIMNETFAVELYFDPKKDEKIIREETIKSIIEVQNLKRSDIDNIQNAIWGFVIKYKSEKDREFLGIPTKEEAIKKSKISGVGFINEDEIDYTFFYVFISTEWDLEHGITISYYNGILDDVE